MKRYSLATAFFAALFLAESFAGGKLTAYGAGGTWMENGAGGWNYRRENGSMAQNSFEDIDGEWYYFDADGNKVSGWRKISNQMYHFEEDGRLTEGWKCLGEGENGRWYYYDKEGNAVIGWFKDNGSWYWFSPDGIMNQESPREIDGKMYWFSPDGALLTNQYQGLQYYNSQGQPEPGYDVRVWDLSGNPVFASPEDTARIEGELNRLPKGWLKAFIDGDWHFVYQPDAGPYRTVPREDGGEYPVYYRISDTERTLYASEPDGFTMGFGAFLYQSSEKERKDNLFQNMLRHREYFILELTGIPEQEKRDQELVFAALFAAYEKEEGRAYMEKEMNDVAWLMETIVESRAADGTRR